MVGVVAISLLSAGFGSWAIHWADIIQKRSADSQSFQEANN